MPVQDSLTFTSAPYYDDFNEKNDFYRVLFRPSYAVQARELTQSQTILQDQITKLANTTYADGDLLSGGGVIIDTTLASVKLENQFDSIDLEVIQFQHQVIEGASDTTGTARAYVVGVVPRDADDYNTLIVRYLNDHKFGDGITVSTDDDSVQATTVSATGPSKIPNASNVASMVSVQESVIYMSGFLNYVPEQYLILEKYSSEPSYSVGFFIDEIIVDENDANASPVLTGTDIGETLLDPANGAYNYNAPGATRYRQKLVLAKREYNSDNVFFAEANTKYLELFRIANGAVSSSFNSIDPEDIFRDDREEFRGQIKPLTLSITENNGVDGTTNSSQVAVITGNNTFFDKDFAVGDIVYLSNKQYYGNGVVSTNGSGFVTGNGTSFQTDFVADQKIFINHKKYDIVSVSNDTSLYVAGQTEKYMTNQPYIVGALSHAEVVSIASNTQMTLNTLVGDGSVQNIINSNTVSVHVEPGLLQYGNAIVNHQRTKTVTVRKPRDKQFVDGVTVGKEVKNYFLVTGEEAPGVIDVQNIDQVIYCHTCPVPNTASQTQLNSTVMATARIRDFVPINVKNVDQGYNEYAVSLWNVKPRTLANTLGYIANNSFLTLNGPTAALEDAYNGVTIEFTSGKLKGHRAKILKYYQNTSCDVEELPNTPLADDGYRFIYQTKDVKAICVHNGLAVPTKFRVSANNGVDSSGGSYLFSQSQDSTFLYELPYEVSTLKDATGSTKTSYRSRRMREVNVTAAGGQAASFTLDSGTGFTFTEFDTQTAAGLDASLARELFQVFVTTSPDTAQTPTGNSLTISSNVDIVTLSGGGASGTKAQLATFFVGDAGALASGGTIAVVYTVETDNLGPKSKTLIEGETITVIDPNTQLGGIDSVQTIDVSRIKAVIDTQVDASGTVLSLSAADLEAAAQGSSLTGANTIYVTENYEIHTGQEDNYYGHGGVRLVGPPPTGQIGIVFDYWAHGDLNGGDFFSIDSYPTTMKKEEIPSYTTSAGKVINLGNAIDFRPTVQNLGIDSGVQNTSSVADNNIDNYGEIWTNEVKRFPTADGGISMSLGYYTNRTDTVVVDTEKDIELLTGIASSSPSAPNLRKEHLELVDIMCAPYVYDVLDVRLKPEFAEFNEFYDMTVNFAESNNKGLPEILGRPQPVVFQAFDNFEGHSKADIQNPDYAAAIDPYENILRPAIITTNWDMNYSPIGSKNVDSYSSLVTAEAITSNTAYTQPFYTAKIPINPFGRSQFRGTMQISPQYANWFDTDISPIININMIGENDGFFKSSVPYKNIFTNMHENYWYGVHSKRDIFGKKSSRQYQNFGAQINQVLPPMQFREQLTPNLSRDLSVAPYLNADTIYFSAKGMKGFANLYMYFDNERVDTRFVQFTKKITFEDAEISSGAYQVGETVRQTVGLETALGQIVLVMKPTPERTQIHIIQTSAQDFSTASVDTVDGVTSNARGNIFTIEEAPTTLFADQYGMVSGAFTIPAGRFTATDKLLRITDADDNDPNANESTFSESIYYGKPVAPSDKTTRQTIARRSDNDDPTVYYTEYDRSKKSTNFLREFGQEIYVDPSAFPKGLFLTGGLVYVANNDSEANTGAPLKIGIKPIVDGFPSPSEILPFSEVIIQATEVNATATPDTENAETQTSWLFSNPVFLSPGKSYVLTFDTDNPEYQLHMARVGESLTNEDHRVPRFKYFPGLWRTNNHGVWKRDDKTMLCLDLHRAKFYNTQNSAAFFNIKEFPSSNVAYDSFYLRAPHMSFGNVAQPEFTYKSTTVSGSDLEFKSFKPNQNYDFSIFGRVGQQRVMTDDANTMTINVSMYTDDEYVSPVLDKDQMQLITVENIINNLELTNDAFIIEEPGFGYDYDTTATGNTNATITISGGAIYANGTEQGQASLIMGPGGRIVDIVLSDPGSLYTGNVAVTITNKTGATPPTTDAIIRVKSETDPYLGNAGSRYISKVYDVGTTAKGIKVLAEGVRPGGTDILVYFRATSGFSSRKLQDEFYQMLPGTQNSNVFGDGMTVFGWQTADDFLLRDEYQIVYDTFSSFQIKVVFISSDSSTVPYLKNMRIFAYS